MKKSTFISQLIHRLRSNRHVNFSPRVKSMVRKEFRVNRRAPIGFVPPRADLNRPKINTYLLLNLYNTKKGERDPVLSLLCNLYV